MNFDFAQLLILVALAGTAVLLVADFAAAVGVKARHGAGALKAAAAIVAAAVVLQSAPGFARDFSRDMGPRDTVHTSTKSGLHFYAGGRVEVTEPADSLFAAGGRIDVDAREIGEMIAAGGRVTLKDVTTSRIIAAGGRVELNGTIDKSLIAAGGRVEVDSGSKIGGDAVLAGGRVSLKSDVGGDLIATAGRVDIAGQIGGDATIRSRDIEFAPGTRIAGNLTYSSPTELKLPEGVVVGTVTREEWDGGNDWDADISWGSVIAVAAFALAATIAALFVFAAVMLILFSRQVDNATAAITDQPLQSLGLGILIAIIVPVTAIILFISLIGIPLGVFALAVYAVLFGIGIVIAAYWTGLKLRGAITDEQSAPGYGARLGWTFLGLILFSIIGLIPIVGSMAQFFALVTGFGAFVLAVASGNSPRNEQPVAAA